MISFGNIWSVAGTAVAAVITGGILALTMKYFWHRKYIPGVPIVKANSFFGFSMNKKRNGKYDSHVQMMEAAEEHGKMFQFYYFGYLWVMINDKFLAKYVMDNVTGKGHFHVSLMLI